MRPRVVALSRTATKMVGEDILPIAGEKKASLPKRMVCPRVA